MGDRSGSYSFFVGKYEKQVPLGRPRRRGKFNVKMDFQDVGWGHGLD
jgi:hypothetical protein